MVYQPKQTRRKKWDAKAKKMFLVGYEATAKNFCLYDQDSGKIITSCDVVFNEKPFVIKLVSVAKEEKVTDIKTKGDDLDITSFKRQAPSTPISIKPDRSINNTTSTENTIESR